MPSARLVFNDDATVLGPVLQRTGEMIKASMSDIPRIRMQQEQQNWQHGQAREELDLRHQALQSQEDQQLLGLLTMGGQPTGKATAMVGAGKGLTPAQQLAWQKHGEAQAANANAAADAPHLEWKQRWQKAYDQATREEVNDPDNMGQKRFRSAVEAKARANELYPPVQSAFADTSDPTPISGEMAPFGSPAQADRVDHGLLQFPGGAEPAIDPMQQELYKRRVRAYEEIARLAATDPNAQRRMRLLAQQGVNPDTVEEWKRIGWPTEAAAPVEMGEQTGGLDAARGAVAEGLPGEPEAPVEQATAPTSAPVRTPDQVRVGEHQRAAEVDAAIQALIAKAAADPALNTANQGAAFSINTADTTGFSPAQRLSPGTNREVVNTLHAGHPAGDVVPEWLGGLKRIRMQPQNENITPEEMIRRLVSPQQVAPAAQPAPFQVQPTRLRLAR